MVDALELLVYAHDAMVVLFLVTTQPHLKEEKNCKAVKEIHSEEKNRTKDNSPLFLEFKSLSPLLHFSEVLRL